ncbi:SDR family NAD(P)-dependent oxidoreductase [Streptantibioticus silvisoli]|uniref:SDR family NAD(P)-dependent oxidoreductase n=1 Tax=Streptantibioticus silvisoli TaxID=2705255 RepID=A0ABT6W404_9ACTN|nr:SDR family NAD(P)-dependent oxidoreductase [Streptantibioticus silvisoli]MDI5965461.1 SDR family NAD(P)-dependent oxidoreductase [Streptantibioticus silvisoli]
MDRQPGCAAEWVEAERAARRWAARAGLVPGARERRRLATAGHGRMAGLVAPLADRAELALLAQWGAFIAAVDDGFDAEGEEGGSPERVREVTRDLLAVLTGRPADPAPGRPAFPPAVPLRPGLPDDHPPFAAADRSGPAVRALTDLWRRTAEAAADGPAWQERFAARYARFAAATRQEAQLRADGRVPGRAEYLEMRRHTITVLPLLDVLERRRPGAAPELAVLRDATADIVAWANDLASGGREAGEGRHTLLSVVAAEEDCDPYEAAARVRTMIAGRMDVFDAAQAALPSGADAGRAAAIRAFRDGALAWQAETRRNRPAATAAEAPELPPFVPSLTTLAVPRAAAAPGERIRSAADRTARRLAPAVAAGGAVPDRCGSRVLESALLLALLRASGGHEAERDGLTRYLTARRPDADAADALLIDACLDPRATAPHAGRAVRELSPGLDSGTAGRGQFKAVMLETVLHLLCGAPLSGTPVPDAVAPDRITTFTDVNLLAVRVVRAHASGRPHAVASAERDRLIALLRTGRDRVLWEGSAATHLLGLHAVRTFRPREPVVADGLLRMSLARNADGGVPFLDSQDVWLSAVAGLAFLADRRLRHLTGRMARFVTAWQADDGGWPFASGIAQTDVDTATRCVEFLRAADPVRYAAQVRRGAGYLTRMAGTDGGFPTWVRGEAPDVDMTAGAVIALAPDRAARPGPADLLRRSVGLLLDAQRPDGTFERSWTVSESSGMARVLDALHAARDLMPSTAALDTAVDRAVGRLADTQNPDGGWGQRPGDDSDVLSTAQAVPVLVRAGAHDTVRRAVDHLLARQQADGGFTSVPDQVGPRPLPFDFPVLANVHALTALRAAEAAATRHHTRRTAHGTANWAALETTLRGRLLRPGDAGYEHGRLPVNQRFDAARPQAVAYPADTADVAACLAFAREQGVPLTVRSGGHSYAGYSTGPGLVVHLAELNAVAADGGRARIGAGTMGLRAHTVLAAAGAGLPLGRCPSIGVSGATLGGGLSAFTRAWGLAADRLTGVEIVTADGTVREIGRRSTGADADLFWAMLGGGGGNFGVVTALEFATLDIKDLAFTTFAMAWPHRDLPALLRGWSEWNADEATPRELRTAVELLSDGGGPCDPVVTGTFIGTPGELAPLLDGLARTVGRPDTGRFVQRCTYVQAAAEPERWGGGTTGPRVAFAAKSQIVREPMTAEAANVLTAAVERLPAMTGITGASGLLIDCLGGAVADVAPDATAFPHRTAVGVVQYHSYWHASTPPQHTERRLRWLRETHAAMHPYLGTGGYVNGMDPELADWAVAYHGANLPRLRRVKAQADPGGLFTFPQSITPEPAGPTAPAAPAIRPPAPDDPYTALAARLRGPLLRPGDPAFGPARLPRNSHYDTVVPQAVARIADEEDAAACLAFAAATGTPVAIRSGGHSYAGYSTSPGLVIDVRELDGVRVTADRVRIGAGVSSGTAARELERHGLALPLGRWGTVGVAGLALGGGKSAFTRAWGLTCDRMTGATIVTPDGAVRHVTGAPGDPDGELFWALRGGGGGNFGVVTSLDFTPVPIGGTPFARFRLAWRPQDTPDVLRGWQLWLADPATPRQVCCDVRLLLDGDGLARPVVLGTWIGGTERLRGVLRELADAVGRPPATTFVVPCGYAEAATVTHNPLAAGGSGEGWSPPGGPAVPGARPGRPAGAEDRFGWAGGSHIVREPMTDAAIGALGDGVAALHRLGGSGGVYLDALGGAADDLAADATAFPHRRALAVLQYFATWPPNTPSGTAEARTLWLRGTHAVLQQHLGTGAYVNDTDPGLADWERAYYGANHPRLQRVKAAYDPHRTLDFPQAVVPATSVIPVIPSAVRLGGQRSGPPKVWFVTGASRGLGRRLVETALDRGDLVAATARDPRALDDLADGLPPEPAGRLLVLPLDVTDADAARAAVDTAVRRFGRLDVVVNNAGHRLLGAVEDTPPDRFAAQLDTTLTGVVNVTRAALPVLRGQRHGHVIQITGIAGRTTAGVGLAALHAAAYGVAGFSAALANEMRPFGVRVTVVEPGGLRTAWDTTSPEVIEPSEPYRPVIGPVLGFRAARVPPPGDPLKAARAILHVADLPDPPLRLPLGRAATALALAAAAREFAEIAAWRPLSDSIDVEG